ncbi:hypothetical protein CF326_g7095 [Tilletia indica]|nr:hypothetical protein CF326_g7095 [Tilletia indica]
MASLSASVRANKPLAAVMRAMHAIAPLHLADKSWDNVGLLLEAPKPRTSNGVFLAIDLTTDVAAELLSEKNKGVSVAVIYHPTIFRGLKSLTLSNTQQRSLLSCAAEGISIYCPHTSLDATPAGINDWLILNALSACSPPTSSQAGKVRQTETRLSGLKDVWGESPDTFARSLLADLPTAAGPAQTLQNSVNADSDQAKSEGWSSAGMGRQVVLREPISLGTFARAFKAEMGVEHAQMAYARGANAETQIKTIAVCAGSGSSVLQGAEADLWITGELSHHELLATTEPGSTSVLLLRHTTSERGFLADILGPRLQAVLREQAGADKSGDWSIRVSQEDRDPLTFV